MSSAIATFHCFVASAETSYLNVVTKALKSLLELKASHATFPISSKYSGQNVVVKRRKKTSFHLKM